MWDHPYGPNGTRKQQYNCGLARKPIRQGVALYDLDHDIFLICSAEIDFAAVRFLLRVGESDRDMDT